MVFKLPDKCLKKIQGFLRFMILMHVQCFAFFGIYDLSRHFTPCSYVLQDDPTQTYLPETIRELSTFTAICRYRTRNIYFQKACYGTPSTRYNYQLLIRVFYNVGTGSQEFNSPASSVMRFFFKNA